MLPKTKLIICLILFSSLKLVSEDKKFVIHVSSYNNAKFCQQTLDSIFSQKYNKHHFRVIFSDNGSTDGTYALVKNYIKTNNLDHRIQLIKSSSDRRKVSHHWYALQRCHDHEIVISLKCGDWFAHRYVLSRLNRIYQNDTIWVTCSNYRAWPFSKMTLQKTIAPSVIKKNSDRKQEDWDKYEFCLITYYAWLAKQIRLEDLLHPEKLFQNKIISLSSDWCLLYPLLEMAGRRFFFDLQVCSVKNLKNQNNFPSLYKINKLYERYVRNLLPYSNLNELPNTKKNSKNIPLIVFIDACNRDDELLRIWGESQPGIKNVSIISYTNNYAQRQLDSYEKGRIEMKYLRKAVKNEAYIALAILTTSEINFTVNIPYYIDLLKRTKAYAYYENIDSTGIEKVVINKLLDNIGFFQFKHFPETHLKMRPHFFIVEAESLSHILNSLPSNALAEDFLDDWYYVDPPDERIGLLNQ